MKNLSMYDLYKSYIFRNNWTYCKMWYILGLSRGDRFPNEQLQSVSCFPRCKDFIRKFLVTNDGYLAGRFRSIGFVFDYGDFSSSNYEHFTYKENEKSSEIMHLFTGMALYVRDDPPFSYVYWYLFHRLFNDWGSVDSFKTVICNLLKEISYILYAR